MAPASEDGESGQHAVEVRWPWLGRLANSKLAPCLLFILNACVVTMAVATIVLAGDLRRGSALKHPWPVSVLLMAIPCLAVLSGIIGCLTRVWEALFHLHIATLVISEVPLLVGFGFITFMKNDLIARIAKEGHSREDATSLVVWGQAMYIVIMSTQAMVLLYRCLFRWSDMFAYEREMAQKANVLLSSRDMALKEKGIQGSQHLVVYSTSLPCLRTEKRAGHDKHGYYAEPIAVGPRFSVGESSGKERIHEVDPESEPARVQTFEFTRHRMLQWGPVLENDPFKGRHDHLLPLSPVVEKTQKFMRPGEAEHFMKKASRPASGYRVSSQSDDEEEPITLSTWASPDPSIHRARLYANKMSKLSISQMMDGVNKK